MRGFFWDVDPQTRIEFRLGVLQKHRVLVNGAEVVSTKPKNNMTIPFSLDGGRNAEITVKYQMFAFEIELRVDNQLILSEAELKETSCIKCGSVTPAPSKFCQKCGSELPGAETQKKLKKLNEARKMIAGVAGLFLISGVVLYFVQASQTEKYMKGLDQYEDTHSIISPADGKQYNVGKLRSDLQRGPWVALGTNLLLAAIMIGLFFYAKRSPLVAIVAAAGVYVSVQVVNAILMPESLNQGLIMKIIIISLLIKGVRSTLELRKSVHA